MILLMGPTATGKSALALTLAEALDGEIVSVDSAQVYRGMDIGTAKPDAATRARVAHHLIDLIAPTEAYSAARFCADARGAIAAVRARGRVPILAGGTMLYFKALTEGLSALPRGDAKVRAAIDAEAARAGWPAMHVALARVDPVTAARIAPHDAQRIQRALEVARLTGQPLSSWQGRREAPAHEAGIVRVALIPEDRARLHREIAQRFDAMLAARPRDAIDALRRLSAGLGAPRRCHRSRWTARRRHRRDAPARQAPAHLASRDAGRALRSLVGRPRRARARGGRGREPMTPLAARTPAGTRAWAVR